MNRPEGRSGWCFNSSKIQKALVIPRFILWVDHQFQQQRLQELTPAHVPTRMHTQTFKLLQLTGQLLIGNYNSIKLGLADHLLCQESPEAGKISCARAVEEKTPGNSCAFSAREGGEGQLHLLENLLSSLSRGAASYKNLLEESSAAPGMGETVIRPGSMQQYELQP